MTATGTRMVVAAAAILASAGCDVGSGRVPAFARQADQNVLLVTIDTLRADALSGPARTPNLDALASHGTRFTFAHAHAVLTRPSHASILTGLYPYEHGVRDHSGYRIRPGTTTIATLLKAQGFATGAFVGGAPLTRAFGLDPGFDVYDDRFGRAGDSDFSLAERPAGAVVAAATTWIAAQHGRWFAWVHVFDPHAPYRPPPPFDRDYAGRPYYGEVAYVDSALKPLFDLAARGSRPTVVLVTGDHGEGLGDHGELTHGTFAYEPTLHVPLIVAQLPDRNGAAGAVSQTPVRHIDVVPTLLDAVGLPVPPALHGRSLLPGAPAVADADVTSYFEAMSTMLNRGWAPLSGVVAGHEKYIDLPVPELYELADDPREAANLADRRADRRRALEVRLLDFHAAPPGERATETPAVAATLQSLGYTSGSAARKAKYTRDDDPKNLVQLDQWITQGVEAWQQGRRDEALETYRRVIAARPSMAIGYKNLAFLQWQRGDAFGAIDTLERAMHAGAIDPAITTQLGSYLARAGKPADAVALLEPLTAADADPDALNALGIAYARGGQAGKAAATFERVLAANPADTAALENLGTLALERGDVVNAETILRRAIATNPGSARAHNGLGVVAMKTGRRDEAFAEWKQAVALAPGDYDALFNLAMELDAAGHHDEARPYLQRFAAEAPPAQYGADIARARRLLR